MRHILVIFINIDVGRNERIYMINLLLTYIVNVIIMLLLLPILLPIIHWIHLLPLAEAVQLLYLRNEQDLCFLFAGVAPLVVGLLYITPPMQFILRLVSRLSKPTDAEYARLDRIVSVLCGESGLPRNRFQLHVQHIDAPNAFALGSKHIAVTKGGLAAFNDEELAGILAHEMGHIVHRDTVYLLMMSGMNLVGDTMVNLTALFHNLLNIFRIIPFLNFIVMIFQFSLRVYLIIIRFILRAPQTLLFFFNARRDEYAADRYACEIGFGHGLRQGLTKIGYTEGVVGTVYTDGSVSAEGARYSEGGFFARLYSTHPGILKRIQHITDYLER